MILTRLRRLPIATRLLVSALVLVLVILPAAGLLLAWNFRAAVNSAFDDRLESILNVVMSGVSYDPVEARLVTSRNLGDSRFDRVFSGWYWQISDGASRELTSRSLWDQRLPVSSAPGLEVRTIAGPRDEHLRVLERDIRLPDLDVPLHVSVAADLDEIESEVALFDMLLSASLVLLGLLLLVMIWLQIRWGLEPLRRIENSLRAVEKGQLQTLDTDLPAELARLSRVINTVLVRDRERIERGRSAAGNMAHAIKTPVSVLTTLAERLPSDQRKAMKGELLRIDEAVRHHLARASAAGPVSLGSVHSLLQVLKPVLAAIGQLCNRRGLTFYQDLAGDPQVRVDAQDLQEIVGNLLENATKWAGSELRIRAQTNGLRLILTVEDDGPGMSEADCAIALRRGGKLDERLSGSGLGLSIVTDLIRLYDGDIRLDRSELGGLKVTVGLPLAV